MVDRSIASELLSLLGELPLMQQKQALNYVKSIKADSAEVPGTRLPSGTPGHKLLKFMGRMSEEDARLMQEAIADCERVDSREW